MFLRNFLNKIKLPFRKDKELYRRLYAILGFYPNNIAYYKQALLHKSSSVKGENGHLQNNERLEFLGDAILDAIVGDIVYRHFEGKREGFLTNTRSKIVQRESLGKLAVEMGLDKLITSSGQRNSHNSYMAGNAFEALVGAIYLDYGYQQCMRFMEKRILAKIINIDKVAYQEVNFKSKLLEWSQKNRIHLEYKDKEQRNEKNGQSMFFTQVVIEGLDCGQGKGYSKKESQQNASKETLLMLKKQKGFEESVFEAKSRRTAMEEQPEALLPDIPDELLMQKSKVSQPAKKAESAPEKVAKKAESASEKSAKPEHKKPQPKQEQPKAEQQKPEKVKQEKPQKQEQQKPQQEKAQPKQEKPQPKKEQPKSQEEKAQPKQEKSQQEQPHPKKEQPQQDKVQSKKEQPKQEQPKPELPKAEKVQLEQTEIVEQSQEANRANEVEQTETPSKPKRKPRPKKKKPVEDAKEPTKVEAPIEETPQAEQTSTNEEANSAPSKPKRRRSHRKPSSHFGDASSANAAAPAEQSAAPASTPKDEQQ